MSYGITRHYLILIFLGWSVKSLHIEEKLRNDWKSEDSHQREVEKGLEVQGFTSTGSLAGIGYPRMHINDKIGYSRMYLDCREMINSNDYEKYLLCYSVLVIHVEFSGAVKFLVAFVFRFCFRKTTRRLPGI